MSGFERTGSFSAESSCTEAMDYVRQQILKTFSIFSGSENEKEVENRWGKTGKRLLQKLKTETMCAAEEELFSSLLN